MPPDFRLSSLASLARFGSTARRRTLIRNLRVVLAELRRRGFAGDVYIGGSFITEKREPGDVDVVLDCSTMDAAAWPAFARGVLAERARWDRRRVDMHVWRPELPRGGVLDALRRDRDGHERALVVVRARITGSTFKERGS